MRVLMWGWRDEEGRGWGREGEVECKKG